MVWGIRVRGRLYGLWKRLPRRLSSPRCAIREAGFREGPRLALLPWMPAINARRHFHWPKLPAAPCRPHAPGRLKTKNDGVPFTLPFPLPRGGGRPSFFIVAGVLPLYFTFSTIALKASGLFIARSASTLRFISTPALCSAPMSVEYDMS